MTTDIGDIDLCKQCVKLGLSEIFLE